MLIDTHCHITHDDYQDIPMLINDIKEAGISKIIVNGVDIKSNIEVLELVNEVVYSDNSNNSELYKLHNNAMEYSNLS